MAAPPRRGSSPKPRMTKWSLVNTSVVGDYGIFKVLRHGVRDGAGTPRRDVVTLTCGDWCNVVAVTEKDELVLVWQYRFGTDALSLEVPGGVIDPGETPEAAARRELREETGYEADSFELLVVVEPNPAIQGNRCWTYVARGAKRVADPSFDELEELELALVPTSDTARLLDEGLVTHALVHAALEAYIRKYGP